MLDRGEGAVVRGKLQLSRVSSRDNGRASAAVTQQGELRRGLVRRRRGCVDAAVESSSSAAGCRSSRARDTA